MGKTAPVGETLRHAQPAHRWQPDKPPSRHTLAVAVRRVGTAQGRTQTIDRLGELAAEAQAWAAVLGAGESAKSGGQQQALEG